MHQEGSFSVRAPASKVWAFFLNPVDFMDALDDPHKVDPVDDDHFRFEIKSGIGFIRGTFNGSAAVTERDPPRRFRVEAHASGPGSGLDLSSTVLFSEESGTTQIAWSADVVLRGAMASLGARLLEGTIEKKVGSFFENVRRRLEGGP